MHRTRIIFFLSEATQQIAVFSDFFTKGEGTETILQLCLHLTNILNYCLKTFSQKSLNPFLHFLDISLILLVDVSGHFYCMNMILPRFYMDRMGYLGKAVHLAPNLRHLEGHLTMDIKYQNRFNLIGTARLFDT